MFFFSSFQFCTIFFFRMGGCVFCPFLFFFEGLFPLNLTFFLRYAGYSGTEVSCTHNVFLFVSFLRSLVLKVCYLIDLSTVNLALYILFFFVLFMCHGTLCHKNMCLRTLCSGRPSGLSSLSARSSDDSHSSQTWLLYVCACVSSCMYFLSAQEVLPWVGILNSCVFSLIWAF